MGPIDINPGERLEDSKCKTDSLSPEIQEGEGKAFTFCLKDRELLIRARRSNQKSLQIRRDGVMIREGQIIMKRSYLKRQAIIPPRHLDNSNIPT